jgi:hypothetical protein
MRTMQPRPMVDPLGVFMASWLEERDVHPVPLISTAIDVEIASGLAVVETRRLFRNDEAAPIEAVMTFPVPVHAVLFALEARIDGRLVKGCAQRRQQARATYESAVEAGKAAVLHEEVLRGIHTLSAANIRPRGEIEVTLRWAAALSHVAGQGMLRIPLAVGDVYGCSRLPDADELTHSARVPQSAQLRITCADGAVAVAGLAPRDIPQDGTFSVPLNRPIDLIAPVASGAVLPGVAADHRRVALTITPALGGEDACRLTVLADCSGSMEGSFGLDASGARLSKHDATMRLVRNISARLRDGDQLDLWQFDNAAEQVGELVSFDTPAVEHLLAQMAGPRGGTEIGRALARVARRSEATDILLVTDGKSHALDVQVLAAQGRRISVLLIGEDSLEANVGHLAALTGGELFIATPANLETVVEALLATVRFRRMPSVPLPGLLEAISTQRGGMNLSAHWDEVDQDKIDESPWSRAVGAFAASLALPSLDDGRAGELAEAEGLVTHLTSLVLVDEAGKAVDGLPGMRKVPLETPPSYVESFSYVMEANVSYSRNSRSRSEKRSESSLFSRMSAISRASRQSPGISNGLKPQMLMQLSSEIAWDAEPARLLAGDLTGLPAQMTEWLMRLAEELRDYSRLLGMAPLELTIALLAHCASDSSRSAARVARVLFGGCDFQLLETVLRDLGLPQAGP